MGWEIEEEIHQNVNSLKQEFSFRNPDGYFITVTEFHKYEVSYTNRYETN